MPKNSFFPQILIRIRWIVALSLILSSASGWTDKAYPGWSAIKIIPAESNLTTYPDIAADGDTLHVVFRSTTTTVADSSGPSDQELLEQEIQKISVLLREGDAETIKKAGGKEKLQATRNELTRKLSEIQNRPAVGSQESAAPVVTTINYTRSEDRGRTWWEKPIVIAQNPEGFMGQTAILVNRQGIHVVYTATMTDNILHLYYISSADNGKTWTEPFRISSTNFRKAGPQLVSIPGEGMLLVWWELEETEVELRQRPSFDSVEKFLQNPQFEATSQTRTHSTIRYSRFGAGTWQADQVLDNATAIVPYLSLCTGKEGEAYAFWSEPGGVDCRVTRNGGQTWETILTFQQRMSREDFYSFVYGGGDYHILRGMSQSNRSGQLSYLKGVESDAWTNIIDEQTQHSFPQMAYTRDEVQIVWGISDLSGKHLLYFRQDNKPPKSVMYYPPTGDFTKHEASFVWGASDDISTRLTYRWCRMPRTDPQSRPVPDKWTLYDEINKETFPAPEDGYYTFFLQAVDFSGNEEKEPIAVDFQTYFVPPGIQSTPSSLPPLVINKRAIQISWKTADNTPSQAAPLVACQVDGNPISNFSQQDSIQIGGLSTGWHSIQLYAMDANGNVSTFGEMVTVKVELELGLVWEQTPGLDAKTPREGTRIFVKDDKVTLKWKVLDNSQDPSVKYFSSYLVTLDGRARNWSTPQESQTAEITGAAGTSIEEGDYRLQVLARDEAGNPAIARQRYDKVLDTTFTVDHTPPEVTFNPHTLNPETGIPTLTVSGDDKKSTRPENIRYQFRVMKEGEQWTDWATSSSFVCEGKPIKFYSWGYKVEARAIDVAGNESRYPVRYSLIWYDRAPWMLYTLVGVVAAIALIVVFMMVAAMRERAHQRKRLAQRRAEAEKSRQESPSAKPAAGSTSDLFGSPDTSAGGGMSSFGSGFDDPFASTASPESEKPAGDPFASSTGFGASSFDFDSPFGKESSDPFGGSTFSFEEPQIPSAESHEPSSTQAGGETDWTDDKKIDLTDQDLFGPL